MQQAAKGAQQRELDNAVTAQSGANPVDLSEILDFDDSLFQDDNSPIQATPNA
jgi:hypothetical protein